MGALLLVEVLEVRAVLEVVGVYFAFLGNGVGLNVVSEFLDFEGVAFLFKLTLDGLVEDLSMGGGGCGDGDRLVLLALSAAAGEGQCGDGDRCDACGDRRERLLLYEGVVFLSFARGV